MKFNIKHDEKNQKFFVLIGGKECALKYNKINEGLFDYKLVFVPLNMRGQGLAGRIAEHALAWARKKEIKIKVSCSYLAEYLSKNKEYEDVIFKKESLNVA